MNISLLHPSNSISPIFPLFYLCIIYTYLPLWSWLIYDCLPSAPSTPTLLPFILSLRRYLSPSVCLIGLTLFWYTSLLSFPWLPLPCPPMLPGRGSVVCGTLYHLLLSRVSPSSEPLLFMSCLMLSIHFILGLPSSHFHFPLSASPYFLRPSAVSFHIGATSLSISCSPLPNLSFPSLSNTLCPATQFSIITLCVKHSACTNVHECSLLMRCMSL